MSACECVRERDKDRFKGRKILTSKTPDMSKTVFLHPSNNIVMVLKDAMEVTGCMAGVLGIY